jgi:N6-L-threonylcarbamoyladenine synthase
MLIEENGDARQLGCTIDDAAGEALDKGAKLLGLGYPGGPIMQKTAEGGDSRKYDFPRPLTGSAGKALSPENRYNFSFSGIKTALLYHVKNHADPEGNLPVELLKDTVASYQEAVVDVLVRKTLMAAKDFNVRTIVVAGGVACNSVLRERFEKLTPRGIQLRLAARKYCTDNAAMIGGLGWHYFRKGFFADANADSYARLPVISKVPFLG